MSAKPSSKNQSFKISEVLQAFFRLDATAQQVVRDHVKRSSDPRAHEAERDRAEELLAALLHAAGGKEQSGKVLGKSERLSPVHQELRAQLEQAEAGFAVVLGRLMVERQVTQAQLAERIGVGQSAIAMLLKRRCRPQRRTLGKLAEALGVPVEELWPGFARGWRSGVM
jgi:DNA-binding XRE family transcriptional regulator